MRLAHIFYGHFKTNKTIELIHSTMHISKVFLASGSLLATDRSKAVVLVYLDNIDKISACARSLDMELVR